MTVNEKITELRKLMSANGIDAYIIPSSDPHMSDYTAEHWKYRSWISGFTGSAGTVVVTQTESGLWTDGRYFIQAEKQLEGTEIKLFRMGLPETPSYIEWVESRLAPKQTAGFSGKVVSVAVLKEMQGKFASKEIKTDSRFDFIGELWKDRPALPATNVFVHKKQYTGFTAAEKIEKVREEMKKAGAGHYIITSLDDIAWLFNIRANDVAYLPVSISYALISADKAYLFIEGAKLPEDVRRVLAQNNVTVEAYEAISERLGQLGSGNSVVFDPKRINCWLYDSIGSGCRKFEADEITAKLKAVKNPTEIENIRNSQLRDGAAMVNFLYWLDKNIGREAITEITIAEKLEYFRSLQDKSMGASFNTIAAYREHGAMMHYSATGESSYVLENKDMIVIDSGGQYLDGTTDITRTVVFDNPTEEMKRDFTMVLKSHIAMAEAKFLYGATGSSLDILARYPLWAIGLNYRCGTGHGIGYFLSVHEGPQNLSQVPNLTKLEAGMLLTDEPGIYTEGKYGIRTENTLLVVEDEKTEYGQFLKFEVISFCPIDLRGIEPGLLTENERNWLNNYHKKTCEKLSPLLGKEQAEWLKEKTLPV